MKVFNIHVVTIKTKNSKRFHSLTQFLIPLINCLYYILKSAIEYLQKIFKLIFWKHILKFQISIQSLIILSSPTFMLSTYIIS